MRGLFGGKDGDFHVSYRELPRVSGQIPLPSTCCECRDARRPRQEYLNPSILHHGFWIKARITIFGLQRCLTLYTLRHNDNCRLSHCTVVTVPIKRLCADELKHKGCIHLSQVLPLELPLSAPLSPPVASFNFTSKKLTPLCIPPKIFSMT